MKRITILISLFVLCNFTYGQDYLKSKSYTNFKEANSIICKSLILNYQNIDVLKYKLKGELSYEGHFSVPKERKSLPCIVNISAYIDSCYLQVDTVRYGEDVYIETGYFSKDSSLVRNSYGKIISQNNIANRESHVLLYSPITLLSDVLNNKSSLRYLGVDTETSCSVVSYTSALGKQVSLFINQDSFLIERAEILKYSPIHGDYLLQFVFMDYKSISHNIKCPQKLVVKEWGCVYQEFNCTYNQISIKRSIDYNFEQNEIANNVFKVTYPTHKHFSYIIDFGDYLGVIETPKSNSYIKHLDSYIREHISSKPIKYVFLTHHHPDHAGGFAYFYNKGMKIISTDSTSVYLGELLKTSHLLNKENDIMQTSEGMFEIINQESIGNYSSNSITLEAIEFPNNGHTKEFLVYYLPKSKILIVGDYFYKSAKTRGSQRAEILEEFITGRNIEVEKIYPTWSPVGMKEYCSIKELKESAKLYRAK
jgi:glyoxylase-like metal-dependent hydrolase (beta-lactamase superfamily II)